MKYPPRASGLTWASVLALYLPHTPKLPTTPIPLLIDKVDASTVTSAKYIFRTCNIYFYRPSFSKLLLQSHNRHPSSCLIRRPLLCQAQSRLEDYPHPDYRPEQSRSASVVISISTSDDSFRQRYQSFTIAPDCSLCLHQLSHRCLRLRDVRGGSHRNLRRLLLSRPKLQQQSN